MKQQALGYKKVLITLTKYPMPIFCVQQTQLLDGVGDITAQKFH